MQQDNHRPVFSIALGVILSILPISLIIVVILLLSLPTHLCTLQDFVLGAILTYGMLCLPVILLIVSGLHMLGQVLMFICKRNRLRIILGIVPIGASIASILIAGFLIHQAAPELDEFHANLNEYNEVIQLVKESEILPKGTGGSGYAALPPQYCHPTHCGDEIMIDTRDGTVRVFFFTDYQPGWGSFGGYAYVSSGETLQAGDFGINHWECTELDEFGWFSCSHPD